MNCRSLINETAVQVLPEPGMSSGSRSYIWLTVGYQGKRPIILFHYHPTRRRIVPETTLAGFSGYLQTDGYAGCASTGSRTGIVRVGELLMPDTIRAKNTIRPFVVGKNWIFSNTSRGAHASAGFIARLRLPRPMAVTSSNICHISLTHYLGPGLLTIESSCTCMCQYRKVHGTHWRIQ